MADLVVRVDATTAGFDAAMAKAGKSTARYEAQLKLAQKAQLEFDAAVAKSGAASTEAAAAQAKLTKSLERVTVAENQAAIAAKRAGEIQAASAAKSAAAAEAAAAKQAAAQRKIGSIAGGVGLAAAAALGLAAKAASDFNAKMATLASLDPSANIDRLASAANNYADIGISASEAADAEIELTKAGISTADILGGGLDAALTLSAAGQLNVADATSIAAQAMTQFQLAGQDLPHVADLLAAGADRALGSVQDLGEGLQYSGLTAHQLGLSVDETVGSLAAFAQAGLLGSQGGAAFQQMLLKLENPTEKAAGLMETYGLSLYDAQGNFVGMESLAGQLQTQFAGLSKETRLAAFSTLFGSRAVRAANVLYAEGADGVADWERKVNDSGFAAEQAAGKMDSLQGDMQKLSAETENAAIQFGQQLQPALRTVTQGLTTFVGFIADVPGPLKEAAALTVAFTAAVGLGTFVYTRATAALASMGTTLGVVATETTAAGIAQSTLNTKMLAIRGGAAVAGIAMLTLSDQAGQANAALGETAKIAGAAALGFSVAGPLGAGIAGGIAALVSYEGALSAINKTLAETQALSNADPFNFDAIIKSADAASTALAGTEAKTHGWADVVSSIPGIGTAVGVAFDSIGDHASDAADQTEELANRAKLVRDGFRDFAKDVGGDLSFDDIAQRLHKLGYSVKEIQDLFVNRNRSPGDAIAFQEAASAVEGWGEAARVAKEKVDALTASTEALTAAFKEDQAVLNERAALRDYADTLKEIADAQKKGGISLRESNELLDKQAQSALNTAATITEGSKAQKKYLAQSRNDLYEQAISFGRSKEAAADYVNEVLGIPKNWKTDADFENQEAMARVKALQQQYGLTPKEVKTIVTAAGADTAAQQVRVLRDYINQLQSKTISIQVNQSIQTTGGFIPGGRVVYGQAEGGPVRGPGGPKDDKVLRALSNGEFVSKTASVQREGVAKYQALNDGRATIVPLASGGLAGAPRHTMSPGQGWSQQKVIVQQAPFPKQLFLVVEGRQMTAFVREQAQTVVNGDRAWAQK